MTLLGATTFHTGLFLIFHPDFKVRILQMAQDVDDSVVVAAVNALQQLFAIGALEPGQEAFLWDLVFSKNKDVADAVREALTQEGQHRYRSGISNLPNSFFPSSFLFTHLKKKAGRFVVVSTVKTQVEYALHESGQQDDEALRNRLILLILLRFRARAETVGAEGVDLMVDSLWDSLVTLKV